MEGDKVETSTAREIRCMWVRKNGEENSGVEELREAVMAVAHGWLQEEEERRKWKKG